MSTSFDHTLETHPLLEKLLTRGVETRALRGYVGPADRDGYIRLYPSLGDLTFSTEISVDDIVEAAPAPEYLLPHQGTILWVRHDAEVVFHGEQVKSMSLRSFRRPSGSDAGPPRDAGRLVTVESGRVRMRVQEKVRSASTCASCTCSSCQTHPTCTSTCNAVVAAQMVAQRAQP